MRDHDLIDVRLPALPQTRSLVDRRTGRRTAANGRTGQPDVSGWRFWPKHQSALPLSLDSLSTPDFYPSPPGEGEGISLTRAVGDSGQSTSRLCHFRLIPLLRLISILLRRTRPFNTRPTAPDFLSRSPISAQPAENALRIAPSIHSRQAAVLENHRESPRWQSALPPWPKSPTAHARLTRSRPVRPGMA